MDFHNLKKTPILTETSTLDLKRLFPLGRHSKAGPRRGHQAFEEKLYRPSLCLVPPPTPRCVPYPCRRMEPHHKDEIAKKKAAKNKAQSEKKKPKKAKIDAANIHE